MVTIHYNGTTINVQEDDSTFRYRSIMGECYVTLKFQLNKAIDFPVGTFIVYQGRTYTLTSPEHWTRWGVHNIEYTLTLHGEQEVLKKYKLRNLQDGRLKFPMMATPAEFLQLIVGNLNASGRESGWTGTCLITAEEKQIEFNHAFLIDALTDIASEFDTEFEITEGKEIRLGKVEYYKSDPLPLAYGKGNGFKPGTGRTNTNDSKPIEILYVQGGEKNIDRSKYGSSVLLLPKGQTLTYEGRQYIASDDGYFIKRNDKALQYKNEDSIDLSDIYPKREGVISRVVTVDVDKHFYDFEDSSIPVSLDYNECLIDGETLTVIFQTGMLAGREFEISKYTHVEDDGQGNEVAARRFEVVPAEMDGYVMPCENFLPAAGDKYIILNCMLPDAYIRDNANQSGAEWDLFREAARFMYENEDFKFTFTGELQAKWAKEHWIELSLSSRLVLGAYIRFTDDDFASGGVDMRITGIKDFFNDPYAPVIEISNGVMAAGFSSQLRDPDRNEVRIGESYERGIAFTKRRWRDARETMTALEEAMEANFQNFSSAINPIAVQTMQMLVGDESLQFRFVNSKVTPAEVSHQFAYDDETKTFSTNAGTIQHMTLGIANMAASHQVSEYKFWDLAAFTSSNLGGVNAGKKYYLYAKCGKSEETGVFVLSEVPIALEGVSGYYYFLVGILNSEYDGTRSFVTLYGFTEILPGRIMTDKIVSGAGTTYWDLVQNIFQMGDKLRFDPANGLILNTPLVQTGSGDTVVIGAWCGEYNASRTYKLGDEVWWTAADGTVSTYRYINALASSGHAPSDDNYWQFVAKGVKGEGGTDGMNTAVVCLYKRASSAPSKPTATLTYTFATGVLSGSLSGWTQAMPATNGNPCYCIQATAISTGTTDTIAASEWSEVVKVLEDGSDGDDGNDGNSIASITEAYARSLNGSTPPSSWSSTKYSPLAGYYNWTRTTIKFTDTSKSDFVSYQAVYCAEDGDNGDPGPSSPYQGEYDGNTTYYATSKRCDVVYYPTTAKWYQALYNGTDRSFAGKLPTNTAYWSDYGANFSNIATGLVLAVKAIIKNAIIEQLTTSSESGAYLSAQGNSMVMYDDSGNQRLIIIGSDLGDTPDDLSYNVLATTAINKSFTAAQVNAGQEVTDAGVVSLYKSGTVTTFTVEDDACSVKIADVELWVRIQNNAAVSSDSDITWQGAVYLAIDGEIMATSGKGFSLSINGTVETTLILKGWNVQVPAGTHTLKLVTQGFISGHGLNSGNCRFMMTVPSITSGLIVAYPSQVTAIGANGFRAMFSGSQKAEFLNDNGTVAFIIRNGNYGMRWTGSALQFTFNGGSTWYSASYDYNSTLGSGYLKLS